MAGVYTRGANVMNRRGPGAMNLIFHSTVIPQRDLGGDLDSRMGVTIHGIHWTTLMPHGIEH